MNRSIFAFSTLLSSVLVFSVAVPAPAETAEELPFLHPLFTDHMVLQRDLPTPIWGWTRPGERVNVTIGSKTASAVADNAGKWMAKLDPLPAGGPHTLAVRGNQSRTVSDVLVGDVWICSGQSNMEWSVQGANNPQEEIAGADHPEIRLFTVPKRIAGEPQSIVESQWQICSPQTAGNFSAVGYFFGRELHKALKVPMGLIHTSWGGTVAEAWTSAEALKNLDDFRTAVIQLQQMVAAQKRGESKYEELLARWWRENDPGSTNGPAPSKAPAWAAPGLDSSSWKTMQLPGNWESAGLGSFDGVVWFRKEIDLPPAWAGKEAMLHLGPIDDIDTTWINGNSVGSMSQYNVPRNYRVPGGILQSGRNVIAVRVLDTGGGGGLFGSPDQMKLERQGDSIALGGPWLYQASTPLDKTSPVPQRMSSNPNVPTVLFNGMIAPLVPYGIKGAIWYQGESNAGRPVQYRTLLPAMIQDWRSRFGAGDFPFFIVQLANFMARKPEPEESQWAELREAQLLTAMKDAHTGLAVIIDIGEANDIHPRNKQDVGRRLALSARGIAYGENIVYSGPIYKSMRIRENAVQLSFDHAGGGLVARGGGKLEGFAIAGQDKKFLWADARIEGETVVVSSPQVEKPVAVRYGWANNPACNLYNKEGLPASPFRTDVTP